MPAEYGDVEFFDGSVGMYTISLLTKEQRGKKDPLWGSGLVVTNPDVVQQMHREYIMAGSSVVSTCTYQASLDLYCQEFNIERDEACQKLADAVVIARNCFDEKDKDRERNFKVAASIGSFGAHLCDMSEYTGSFAPNYSIDDMITWHKEMVTAFTKTSPDIMGFETVPVIKEVQAIMTLMSEFYPKQKFYLSFACNSPTTLGSGEPFVDAVKEIIKYKELCKIAAIGINCSAVENTTSLLQSAKDSIEQLALPILIMPNLRFGGFSPDEFEDIQEKFFACIESECLNWYSLGVRWFGLCCRTNPPHITRLKDIVERKLNLQGDQKSTR